MLNALKSLKVWLVDDDPDLCDAYFEYISEFFDVSRSFSDPLEALQEIKIAKKEEIPDVIVVDHLMPGLDGITLSREIAKLKLPTVILLVSGDERLMTTDEVDALNIIGNIRKPCSPILICNAIYHHGIFREISEKIRAETLALCRQRGPHWEFFLSRHSEIEATFLASPGRRSNLIGVIHDMQNQAREQGIPIPEDSELAGLFKRFNEFLGDDFRVSNAFSSS